MFTPALIHAGHLLHVGHTQVFGLALHRVGDHRADCVYLNLAGPATSVESVWAALVERRTVTFQPAGQTHHHVRHLRHGGLDRQEGSPYVRFQRRIPSLQIDHLILLDKRFVEPAYAETGLTFVFEASHLAHKVYEHVQKLVNLPVFREWAERLPEVGRLDGLLLPLEIFGEQKVYALNLDRARWELQLRLRLERGELGWPGEEALLKPLAALPEEPRQPATPQDAVPSPRAQIAYAMHSRSLPDRRREPSAPDSLPAPRTPITSAPHTRSQPHPPPPLADLTLPDRLVAQGWRLHLHGGTAQARGPGRSTRHYSLPIGAAEAQIAEVHDQLVREIEGQAASGDNGGEAAPDPQPEPAPTPAPTYTLTHERDWTWLAFEQKPPEWALIALKTHGFRWGRTRRAWYCKRHVERQTVDAWLKPQ